MTRTSSRILAVARFGATWFSVLLSICVGFMSQASSPDYRSLFFSLFSIAAVNVALIAFVCASREKAKIWTVAVPAVLGFASYFEMACRVMFGFRLI